MWCLVALMMLCLLAGCAVVAGAEASGGVMYRVNCGADRPYTDGAGAEWRPDRVLGEGGDWGAVGGGTVTREEALMIHETPSPEVYRTERFGAEAYEFGLPEGVYTVRLHFAETFDSNFRTGMREFDVYLAGRRVLKDFDPFKEAGGFARPVVKEFTGVVPQEGRVRIAFRGNPEINGIEIFRETEERAAPSPALKKVLFIGNSYTIFWALPETIEAMVNSGQDGVRVEAYRSLLGGKGIEYHYDRTDAVKKIEEGSYDYVVVQGVSRCEDPADRRLEYVGKFRKAIERSGARMLLYCTWAGKGAPLETYDMIAKANFEAAQKAGVTFAPVGPAWAAATRERPGINLHNPDRSHPGMHGSYLAACVFYALLTGRSPEGHPVPAVLGQEVPIAAETASFLQRVAWNAVREYASRQTSAAR